MATIHEAPRETPELTNSQVASQITELGSPDGQCQIFVDDGRDGYVYYTVKKVTHLNNSNPLAIILEAGDVISTG